VRLPSVNVWIAGCEVDAVWWDECLIVELDSRTYHERRIAFEEDRKRDAALMVAGYRVLRITDVRLAQEPAVVMREVAALLARSPAA
jgi:very-short-patch-repair endonuclease